MQLKASLQNQATNPVDPAFYTAIQQKDPFQSKISDYVNNLDQKIKYAKWKQNLVLKFNYLPLKRVAEKVQNQKKNYLNRIANEEGNCAKILSGKEITVQLDNFRDFSKKLDHKMKQIETQIIDQRIKNEILERQVLQKKDRLKGVMKENMNLQKVNMKMGGITCKSDIAKLVRSSSTKERLSFIKENKFLTSRKHSEKKIRIKSTYSTKSQKIYNSNINLYGECLQKLKQSIKSMKTTEDIQSGIFLDVMPRPDKKFSENGRYSLKSNICDTLHKRFGSIQAEKQKALKNQADFTMDWSTFNQLNWKQIMGIVMVKDKKGEFMKNLLKFE